MKKVSECTVAEDGQTRFVVPPFFLKIPHCLPALLEHDMYMGEFREVDLETLDFTFAEEQEIAYAKRYSVVRHHGSVIVSLPRFFLKNNLAQPGDMIDVFYDERQPKKLFLKFRRRT